MKRLPTLLSFVLFLALSASVTYWLLQWLAPPARPVTAPSSAQQTIPPLSAAANLFGGNARGSALATVQLRGLIYSGRASDSIAIIAAEGAPPRALRVNSEVLPGVVVKEVHARTVVLSEKGAERELTLPVFAAQAGGVSEIEVAPAAQQGNPAGNQGVVSQQPVTAPAPNVTGSAGGVGTTVTGSSPSEVRTEADQRR